MNQLNRLFITVEQHKQDGKIKIK